MGNMLGVLMVEDNPGDARLTRTKLAQTGISGVPMFEVEWVDNLTEGLVRLGNGALVEGKDIDVVLTDLGSAG
jgi:CheY-like chemotaxis protein